MGEVDLNVGIILHIRQNVSRELDSRAFNVGVEVAFRAMDAKSGILVSIVLFVVDPFHVFFLEIVKVVGGVADRDKAFDFSRNQILNDGRGNQVPTVIIAVVSGDVLLHRNLGVIVIVIAFVIDKLPTVLDSEFGLVGNDKEIDLGLTTAWDVGIGNDINAGVGERIRIIFGPVALVVPIAFLVEDGITNDIRIEDVVLTLNFQYDGIHFM